MYYTDLSIFVVTGWTTGLLTGVLLQKHITTYFSTFRNTVLQALTRTLGFRKYFMHSMEILNKPRFY